MAVNLTSDAFSASQQTNLEPQIVLQIDGVSTLFGAATIKEIVKIGNFVIGDGTKIGDLVAINDQSDYITFEGSSSRLKQSINPDKGQSSTITSMQVALIDKNKEISALIAPDETTNPAFDFLGRKMKVWAGFENLVFPDDYILVHKGICDDIGAELGKIIFNIAHPDQKKRALIFEKRETELSAGINDSVTTIPVNNNTSFLKPVLQPDEITTGDSNITYGIRINDEIITYTDTDGTNFLNCTRGALNTIASSHSSADLVESFSILEGNTITLALKLMLSGKNGPYVEALEATNFVKIDATTSVANAIWFKNQFLVRDYNITNNDYVTVTGASNGANNVTGKKINSISTLSNGTYIVLDDVSFVEEIDTAALIDIRSGYDTLGDGLEMDADDVDIIQHEFIRDNFLQSVNQRFYLREEIENGKDFIEQQLFLPAACFSVPRKTRSSVNYHIGPLPTENLKVIDASNVKNANKLKIRRTIAKSFKNIIVHKRDEDVLEGDRFLRNTVRLSSDSLARIKVGKKPLVIEAKGLREDLSGDSVALDAGFRLLDRYQFAAETIDNVKMNYATGFNLEVGDIVVVDMSSLQLTDIKSGTREGISRLMEVSNKTLDLKSFDITASLTDTNFSLNSRYGLISPTSLIKSASDGLNFILDPDNDPRIGLNEYLKWVDYVGCAVRVHNFDHSTVGTSVIKSVGVDNTIELETDLGFTPSAGMYMNMDDYDNQPDNVKLIYVFMSDADNAFADGGIAYQML